MQMLEPVALPGVVLDKTKPCWFCEDQKTGDKLKNKKKEDPASPTGSMKGPENYRTNCASLLGTALGTPPSWTMKHKVAPSDPLADGTETAIVPAAHHLLPGNASVNKATDLHPFMRWKGNPLKLWGDIGYDINNRENGVWLPGNYAVRRPTKFKKNWSKFPVNFQSAYAKEAMRKAGNKQLHDAHSKYNDKVLQTLQQIGRKLKEKWKEKPTKCPVCGKELSKDAKNKVRPPYGLVGRLNLLSGEHRKALDFPKQNRGAINSGYYTSSSVKNVYG